MHPLEIQPLGTIIFTVAAGILALILGEKTRFPSILFLLLIGTLLGPEFANLIQPEIFRENFPQYIAVMVALILFEGGASLKVPQFRAISGVVRNLLSIGVIVTLASFALAVRYLTDLGWTRSILLGSIMIVTGPTVVIPILQRIRLKENLHNILKWEAILIDPLGVIVSVVLFEFLLQEKVGVLEGMGLFAARIALGVLLGLASGACTLFGFRRKWLLRLEGEELGGLFVLGMTLFFFGISEWILPDSGLVTATTAGIFLGNKKFAFQEQIFHFKKQITLLALSVLFILLSSDVPVRATLKVLPEGAALLAILIFVVRPLSVFLSTLREKLSLREKWFLSFLAPRGIVSASLASLFAIAFDEQTLAGSGEFLPLAFLIIAGAIVFYALVSGPAARWFGVQEEKGRTVVVVGANPLGLLFAEALRSFVPVKLIDTNPFSCRKARQRNFEAYTGSAFDSDFLESLDLKGVGVMLALTPNHEVNVLSCQTFSRYLTRNDVYRLWDKTDDWKTVAASDYDLSWGKPLLTPWDPENRDLWDLVEGKARVKIEKETLAQGWKFTEDKGMPPRIGFPIFFVSKGKVSFPVPHAALPEGCEIYFLVPT